MRSIRGRFGRAFGFPILIVGTLVALSTGLPAEEKEEEELKGDVYPLDTCIVSGMKLGSMGDPFVHEHQKREIRFCCGGCVGKFKKDSAEYLKKIDDKIVKQQLKYYPLATCVVSGEKLGGEMGKPVDYVYRNRLVRFCCKGCITRFEKDPKTYWKKMDRAVIEKQKAAYPLTTCVVSGQDLESMGGGVDYVHANRLVRFCCKGCINAFRKEPLKYMAMIDEALQAQEPAGEGSTSAHEHGTRVEETTEGSGEKPHHETHGEGSAHKH